MLKLQETPYIINHTTGASSARTICCEIKNDCYRLFASEDLAWHKNNAYSHYDVAFISMHNIIKNLLKPYFRTYKTKKSKMWYSVIFHHDSKFTCLIKSFNTDKELKDGLKAISNEYHVSYFNIEYRKLGDLKLNNEIEDFISTPIHMYEHAINYKQISLKLLGEDGKVYE